jgi:hypothetical protein
MGEGVVPMKSWLRISLRIFAKSWVGLIALLNLIAIVNLAVTKGWGSVQEAYGPTAFSTYLFIAILLLPAWGAHCLVRTAGGPRQSMRRVAHIAALLLMGWYLLLPRIDAPPPALRKYWNGSDETNPLWSARNDLPINQWRVAAVFDVANECNVAKHTTQQQAAQRVKQGDAKGLALAEAGAAIYAVCVSTDDPRLSPK